MILMYIYMLFINWDNIRVFLNRKVIRIAFIRNKICPKIKIKTNFCVFFYFRDMGDEDFLL
jgi:hypothetical protein